MSEHYGTGRRKSSVARVFLRPGSGKFIVNKQDMTAYFKRELYHIIVQEPFKTTETEGQFDVVATVKGGGTTGQAGALRHGVARALLSSNEELRSALRKAGMLTRDAREVERKKYGQRGARAKFQFSKR